MNAHDIFAQPKYRALGYDKLLKKLAHDGVVNFDAAELRRLVKEDPYNQMAKRPNAIMKIPGDLHITAPPGNWQIDLVFFPYRRMTSSYMPAKTDALILMLVEIPSRFVWARPLKGTNMIRDIIPAYQEFVTETLRDSPLIGIYGDTQFNAIDFRAYNTALDVQVFTTTAKNDHITKYGDFLGILDRCVRTLRDYLQKFTWNTNVRWDDNLADVVALYNDTPSDSLNGNGQTPGWMHSHYDAMMGRYHLDSDANMQLKVNNHTFFRRFRVGDLVRYLIATYPFDTLKKYIPRFTRDVYVVKALDGNKYLIAKRGPNSPVLPRRFAVPELIHAYGMTAPAPPDLGDDENTPEPIPARPSQAPIHSPPSHAPIPSPPSPAPIPSRPSPAPIPSRPATQDAPIHSPPASARPSPASARPSPASARPSTEDIDDGEDLSMKGKDKRHDRDNRKVGYAIRALRDAGVSARDISEEHGYGHSVVENELDPLTPPDPGPPHPYLTPHVRRKYQCFAIYLYLSLHYDYTDVQIYTILAEMGYTYSINAYKKLLMIKNSKDSIVTTADALKEYADTTLGSIDKVKRYIDKWLQDRDQNLNTDVERRRNRIRKLFEDKDPETFAKNLKRYPQFTHDMLVDALGDDFENKDVVVKGKQAQITKREKEIRDKAFEKIWNDAPDTKKLDYHDFLGAPHAKKSGAQIWMAKKRKTDPKFPSAKKIVYKKKVNDHSSSPESADLKDVVDRKTRERERHFLRTGTHPPEPTKEELRKIAKKRKTHREYVEGRNFPLGVELAPGLGQPPSPEFLRRRTMRIREIFLGKLKDEYRDQRILHSQYTTEMIQEALGDDYHPDHEESEVDRDIRRVALVEKRKRDKKNTEKSRSPRGDAGAGPSRKSPTPEAFKKLKERRTHSKSPSDNPPKGSLKGGGPPKSSSETPPQFKGLKQRRIIPTPLDQPYKTPSKSPPETPPRGSLGPPKTSSTQRKELNVKEIHLAIKVSSLLISERVALSYDHFASEAKAIASAYPKLLFTDRLRKLWIDECMSMVEKVRKDLRKQELDNRHGWLDDSKEFKRLYKKRS